MNDYEAVRSGKAVDVEQHRKSDLDGKSNLPGMQTGQNSANAPEDVCQMTAAINNPNEKEQKSRG